MDYKPETTITAIDLSLILSGGVGKDGIPAIHEPKFTSISDSSIHDDTPRNTYNYSRQNEISLLSIQYYCVA